MYAQLPVYFMLTTTVGTGAATSWFSVSTVLHSSVLYIIMIHLTQTNVNKVSIKQQRTDGR